KRSRREWADMPTIWSRCGRLSTMSRVLVPMEPVEPRTTTRRRAGASEFVVGTGHLVNVVVRRGRRASRDVPNPSEYGILAKFGERGQAEVPDGDSKPR